MDQKVSSLIPQCLLYVGAFAAPLLIGQLHAGIAAEFVAVAGDKVPIQRIKRAGGRAGVDGALDEQTRIGLVTGYSDSSLSMGSGTHSSAKVDSYHLGAYAGREVGERPQHFAIDARMGPLARRLGDEQFGLIVANPPYIAAADPHLVAGDVRFEPASALVAGVDGLDDLRLIIAQAPQHLEAGGWLMLEHGYDQAEAVRDLLLSQGFDEVHSRKDLGGHQRISLGRLPC